MASFTTLREGIDLLSQLRQGLATPIPVEIVPQVTAPVPFDRLVTGRPEVRRGEGGGGGSQRTFLEDAGRAFAPRPDGERAVVKAVEQLQRDSSQGMRQVAAAIRSQTDTLSQRLDGLRTDVRRSAALDAGV